MISHFAIIPFTILHHNLAQFLIISIVVFQKKNSQIMLDLARCSAVDRLVLMVLTGD